jgi:hypothetical protein
VSEEGLQHGAFWANTARAAGIDRAHLQQAHIAVQHAKSFREIVHTRVNGEETADRPGASPRALVDQVIHF